MEWRNTPLNEATLLELIHVLSQADDPRASVQQQLLEAVSRLNNMPDGCYYLTYIFVELASQPLTIRQRAGLLLKNRIAQACSSRSYVMTSSPAVSAFSGRDGQDSPSVGGDICASTPEPTPPNSSPAPAQASTPGHCSTPTTLRNTNEIPPAVLECVKRGVLMAVSDPQKVIRQTAGTVLTKIIVAYNGARTWPEALDHLVNCLGHTDELIVESVFDSLNKIVEDTLEMAPLDEPVASDAFLLFCHQKLLTKVFNFADTRVSLPLRRQAINMLNTFSQFHVFTKREFIDLFQQYWLALGRLATDEDPEIRKAVVAGMLSVLDAQPDVIFSSSDSVFEFMVQCSNDPIYSVRLEAMQFWPGILRSESNSFGSLGVITTNEQRLSLRERSIPIIRRYFDRLLPCLVRSTQYTEWDYCQMESTQIEDDNAGVPDEVEDIAPRIHKEGGSADDDGNEEDELQHGTWGSSWTVRKAAALALDNIATTYKGEILPYISTLLQERLESAEWEVRESAVLMLGAIARGCMQALEGSLPRVMGFLLKLCSDTTPLLRSISCWCVSRFGAWICQEHVHEEWLRPVLVVILTHVLDKNKRVQEAACSAFACLEEEARDLLVPLLPLIIEQLVRAFEMYQAKNLLILLDAVGTLADAVGSHLNTKELGAKLLTPIFHRWTTMDGDSGNVAMFECMTCISKAFGRGFLPYAPAVLEGCTKIIASILIQVEEHASRGDSSMAAVVERPNREMLECCLDVLSGLVEALQEQIAELLRGHPQFQTIRLLEQCCKDPAFFVMQAAFALVGDLSKHCGDQLMPHLNNIIPELTGRLLHGPASVRNNAGWAIGEIAVHIGAEPLRPFAEQIALQLTKTVERRDVKGKLLLQNACITLGRLGSVCAAEMAPHLESFARPWCVIMSSARNDVEKVYAFQGMCHLLASQPRAAISNLGPLLDAVASFHSTEAPDVPPPPGLKQLYTNMFHYFRTSAPLEWDAALKYAVQCGEVKAEQLSYLQAHFGVGASTSTGTIGVVNEPE